jgi:integrase
VLFSERSKGTYCAFQLETWWVGIRERAGVEAAPGDKAVHLHDLRSACATNALDRGVRLETVSRRILRHSTLGTTEIYLRGKDVGNLDQAIEAMEAGIVRDQRKGPKRSSEEKMQRGATEQTSGSEHT